FLFGGDLLSFDDPLLSLVDYLVPQLAVCRDLLAQLIHYRLLHDIYPFDPGGLLYYLASVFQNLPGDAEQFAVFRLLLGVPLLGRHPFECLHAAARATRAIGEALYPAREHLMEILDQPRDRAHRVPQQGGIGREMDIGFHHRGIDAQLLAIFQTKLDGGLDHSLIDGLHGGWGKPIEGAVESIVLWHAMAVEVREDAQSMAVVDAFPQLAIVPIFDAHEEERAQG